MSSCAEIELPGDPIAEENDRTNPDIKKAELENQPKEDFGSYLGPDVEINGDDDIVHHYLTFETDLPIPAYLPRVEPSSTDTRSPPPQRPNLKKYGDPFQWSKKRKSILTWMSVTSTMLAAYAAGSYSSGEVQMEKEWGVSSVALNVGITTFVVGFGVAPMVLAPFSEING
jgi:hypothetical protein